MTALALSEHLLFSGEGPFLKVHSRRDAKLLATYKVFDSQAIHGIVPYTHPAAGLIVWGGHCISTFAFLPQDHDPPHHLAPLSALKAPDWILDVSVSPFPRPHPASDHCAALLTAHNALLLLNLGPSSKHPCLTELTSNSRCILYSANLSWQAPHHLLIASGTVFGEIVVWSCFLNANAAPKSVLHQVLAGHDGSIFGVDILEAPIDDSNTRTPSLLASCSDDRTIRIWDISDLPETPIDPHAPTEIRSERDTGFGVNVADALPDEISAGHCISKTWAHASRIWRVRFLPPCEPAGPACLASFGEDATTQFWKVECHLSTQPGSGNHNHTMSHLATLHEHTGKNIWSSAVAQSGPGRVTVATGGADASIVLSDHSLPVARPSDSLQRWTIDDFLRICPSQLPTKPDRLRSYAFVNEADLIVSTDSGNVFLLMPKPAKTRPDAPDSNCLWVSHEPTLRGYSVATSVPSLSLSFTAGLDGTVLVYDALARQGLRELVRTPGKVSALFAKSTRLSAMAQDCASLLVINIESQKACLLCIRRPQTLEDSNGPAIVIEWSVQLPAGFVVTSYDLVESPLTPDCLFKLVLGSRNGAMAMYSLPQPHSKEQLPPVGPDLLLEAIHGKDAVTDLAWIPGDSANACNDHMFSVGRDGAVVVHQVTSCAGVVTVKKISQTLLPFGTLLEGLRIHKADGVFSIWGFNSKKFVVIDMITESQLMSVECGGANRAWKLGPPTASSVRTLAWTKASQLYLAAEEQKPYAILNRGCHGREIKAVAVRPQHHSEEQPYEGHFATGSEDTNIKIFSYSSESQTDAVDFRCIRTLRKHNTGIQHLQWSADGQYLFSSGGFEEFFVWKVQKAPLIGLGVVCESICPTESDLPDLRIMSFSVREIGDGNNSSSNDTGFLISMVRSDSTIRVYSYLPSAGGQEWKLLFTGNYMTSCLTQCLDSREDQDRVIITAGTDGHVAFWPIGSALVAARGVESVKFEPLALKWSLRHQIHQSTIHCMTMHWLQGSTDCLLFTGGDDNAIAVTRCTWEDGNKDYIKVSE